jgi:hypothetical protein
MPYKIGTVTNANGQLAHFNMLKTIRDFAGGYGDIGTIVKTGTGNGTVTNVDSTVNAPTETWTLTCISTATNGGVFSVEGSVSGTYSVNATVGVPYSNDRISFTINDGTTDFALGDEFTIPVTQNELSQLGIEWEILRFSNAFIGNTANVWQLIMKGKGFTSDEEIFVGMYIYESVASDYYNFTVATMRGFLPLESFVNQPGISPRSTACAHNISIAYWLSVNEQRVNCVMKVGTPVYEMFSVGKFFPYAFPSQYPQPLMVCGTIAGTSTLRFSDTSAAHTVGLKGNLSQFRTFLNDGTWNQSLCFPYSLPTAEAMLYNGMRPAGAGTATYTYPLLPIEIYTLTPSNVYGRLDGFFWITGFDNVTENTVTISGKTFVIFQDVFRNGFGDYYAMELN